MIPEDSAPLITYDKAPKEKSSLPTNKDDFEENHDDQANEEPTDDFWEADWGIGHKYVVNESPIEFHEKGHDEVGSLIQEGVLEDMDIVAPCEVDISNFFRINEGKWDINHHFDNDPIYDVDMKNEVEVGFPFLLGITHNDTPIHTIKREDHYFPVYEEGLLEVVDHIYEINDNNDRSLAFPCLPQDSKEIAALSMSHCFTPSHDITDIDELFPPPDYDVEEKPLIRHIPSSQSYPLFPVIPPRL